MTYSIEQIYKVNNLVNKADNAIVSLLTFEWQHPRELSLVDKTLHRQVFDFLAWNFSLVKKTIDSFDVEPKNSALMQLRNLFIGAFEGNMAYSRDSTYAYLSYTDAIISWMGFSDTPSYLSTRVSIIKAMLDDDEKSFLLESAYMDETMKNCALQLINYIVEHKYDMPPVLNASSLASVSPINQMYAVYDEFKNHCNARVEKKNN